MIHVILPDTGVAVTKSRKNANAVLNKDVKFPLNETFWVDTHRLDVHHNSHKLSVAAASFEPKKLNQQNNNVLINNTNNNNFSQMKINELKELIKKRERELKNNNSLKTLTAVATTNLNASSTEPQSTSIHIRPSKRLLNTNVSSDASAEISLLSIVLPSTTEAGTGTGMGAHHHPSTSSGRSSSHHRPSPTLSELRSLALSSAAKAADLRSSKLQPNPSSSSSSSSLTAVAEEGSIEVFPGHPVDDQSASAINSKRMRTNATSLTMSSEAGMTTSTSFAADINISADGDSDALPLAGGTVSLNGSERAVVGSDECMLFLLFVLQIVIV